MILIAKCYYIKTFVTNLSFGYFQSLHASLQQKQRLKSLESFSNKPQSLLLATDVAARGLDIPNIQHVVHYQVPRTAEVFLNVFYSNRDFTDVYAYYICIIYIVFYIM